MHPTPTDSQTKSQLSRLNDRQRQAVLHGDGPLLVLAGAGSGKTSTMAHRIAHLVGERKVPGHQILGLSFTNKAARELKERVIRLLKQSLGRQEIQSRGLLISTFHSLCARMLRENAQKLGFSPQYTILDSSDQKDVLKDVLKHISLDDSKFDPDRLLFAFSQLKSALVAEDQIEDYFRLQSGLPGPYAEIAIHAFGKYQAQLKLLNAMDFDDLQYYAVRLLKHHADARESYQERFRYILVDEYQDTNPTQFHILNALTQRRQNICVVGDDDQSIYSWRGADATHILEFKTHFPAAQVVTLDQNYRSTSMILDAANAVIANNRVRHPKKLWSARGEGHRIQECILDDDREEAEFVAQRISDLSREWAEERGGELKIPNYRDYVILYRSNAQSRLFEEALRRHKIPYQIVGGQSFLDRKEVKNLLSYFRLLVNPQDDPSLRRIYNWPSRGIGRGSLEKMIAISQGQKIPLAQVFAQNISDGLGDIPGKAALSARNLMADLDKCRQSLVQLRGENAAGFGDWARNWIEHFGLKDAIRDEEEKNPGAVQRRIDCMDEVVHALAQLARSEQSLFDKDGLSVMVEFLSRMTLQAQEEEERQEQEEKDSERDGNKKNQVTLLTFHGAKGLEYPTVFLVGAEEGYLPHKRTIEGLEDLSEERRLAYVGITRAKDQLFLTRCKNRIRYGKPVPRERSRFLNEIPEGLLEIIDRSFPDANSTKEHQKQHEERVMGFLSSITQMLKNPGAPQK